MTRPALLDQGERTDEGRGSLPSPSLLHLPAPPPIFRLKISPKKRREKVFLSQTWVKFLPMVALLGEASTLKMVNIKNKSEENAIKTGYIAESIDIYSLFWHKTVNFACVLLYYGV